MCFGNQVFIRAPLKECFCKLIRTSCTYCILYIICLIIFCFVKNKIVCSNINKVCLMFYYLKTLNKIITVKVVLLVFAPSQDQHHIDSFHRNYVKQSKRKWLLEHFLVVRQWYVSRTHNKLLIIQRDIQLGLRIE